MNWKKSEGEMNHERLWTLSNKLRVLEGRIVGQGWLSLVVGIKEGYALHGALGVVHEQTNREQERES